jgi:hypothetical protein
VGGGSEDGGCGGAAGVEVLEALDSAASLVEERVTLRDMSEGSHQDGRWCGQRKG